ncbi:MAG: hypothetical protein IIX93_02110, partial [Clostridia bacterium]|nr:hypothetical protein [Clostridia bacterium]
ALAVSPILAKNFEVSTPLLMAWVLLVIGLMAYIVFCIMDSRLDKQEGAFVTTTSRPCTMFL